MRAAAEKKQGAEIAENAARDDIPGELKTVKKTDQTKMHLFALSTILLWSTAFPVTKMVGDAIPPTELGAIRCVAAALFLCIIGAVNHIRRPGSIGDCCLLALAGALGFGFYMIFFNTGMQTLTSATSSLVIATTPVMTALAASRLYNERLSRVGYLAIASAFIGVMILLLWDGVLSINTGVIWTFGAAVLFCGYNLLNRKLQAVGYSSMEIMTYAMISAAVILTIAAPHAFGVFRRAGLQNALLAIYLGIAVSAAGYFLWAKAFEKAEHTSDVTNYMFLTPLVTTVLGFIMLKEVPDPGTVIGGAIIVSSVIVFNKYGKKRA